MWQSILTWTSRIPWNELMSRRTIAVVVVFLGALVIANIVVLAIWLPKRKSVTAQPATASVAPNNRSPGASPITTSARSVVPAGDLVSERQITSTSGNLRIKYLRDRKSKIRRIVVEDAHRPEATAVLCESKRSAWALVSPDDQWIAVDERNATDGGGARLYHRSGNSSVQYVPAEGAGPEGHALQDTVWQTYLKATHADSNTPRRGVTIDATAWENDSRKLNISVAYLPAPDNPDVPEPWSCTYDVASKQVEPTPDQPTVGSEMASASTANQDGNQSDAAQDQASDQEGAAGNPFSDNAQNSETEEAEVAESDEYPGEKFPATRLDELAVPDVNESSLSDITYAINEMYARHGAEFKDKKVTKQFSEFPWYKPRPGLTFDDIEKEFSDLEKENLKVLGRCRDAKLATAHRKSRPGRGEKAQEESTGEKVLRGIRTWQELGGPMPPHP
jgi:YARHG domain